MEFSSAAAHRHHRSGDRPATAGGGDLVHVRRPSRFSGAEAGPPASTPRVCESMPKGGGITLATADFTNGRAHASDRAIMAAILMARDSTLGGRDACRLVPGVNENAANSRMARLAVKVRALLEAWVDPSLPLPYLSPTPQPVPAAPTQPTSALTLCDEPTSWDLPPLEATREPPPAALRILTCWKSEPRASLLDVCVCMC